MAFATITKPKITRENAFSFISRNLQFEAENTQQSSNNPGDDSLDAELQKTREQRDADPNAKNPVDSSSGDDNQGGGDIGNLGNPDSLSTGESDPNAASSGQDNPMDEKTSPIGGLNRKLTLYSEFNRILSVLKESVDALLKIDTTQTEIKSCVAQLQKIYDDGKLVISKFEDYSEADCLINFELLKERSSLILEQLARLQIDQKPNSGKEAKE